MNSDGGDRLVIYFGSHGRDGMVWAYDRAFTNKPKVLIVQASVKEDYGFLCNDGRIYRSALTYVLYIAHIILNYVFIKLLTETLDENDQSNFLEILTLVKKKMKYNDNLVSEKKDPNYENEKQ